MKNSAFLILAAGISLASAPANAAVEMSADVDGLGTFIDTSTGLQWLRLDNFFNQSANQMIATASASGFQVASISDLNTLFSSLPSPSANFSAYSDLIGSAPNRNLIWGAYGDITDTNLPWAFAFSDDGTWRFGNGGSTGGNVAPNAGTPDADMNLWAFRASVGGAVPEPATWAMMLLGFGFVGGAIRSAKRKQKIAVSYA